MKRMRKVKPTRPDGAKNKARQKDGVTTRTVPIDSMSETETFSLDLKVFLIPTPPRPTLRHAGRLLQAPHVSVLFPWLQAAHVTKGTHQTEAREKRRRPQLFSLQLHLQLPDAAGPARNGSQERPRTGVFNFQLAHNAPRFISGHAQIYSRSKVCTHLIAT